MLSQGRASLFLWDMKERSPRCNSLRKGAGSSLRVAIRHAEYGLPTQGSAFRSWRGTWTKSSHARSTTRVIPSSRVPKTTLAASGVLSGHVVFDYAQQFPLIWPHALQFGSGTGNKYQLDKIVIFHEEIRFLSRARCSTSRPLARRGFFPTRFYAQTLTTPSCPADSSLSPCDDLDTARHVTTSQCALGGFGSEPVAPANSLLPSPP